MTITVCDPCINGEHDRCDRSVSDVEAGNPIIRDCVCALGDHDPDSGAYGIRQNPAGAFACATCGRRWSEDITPAGRCPWEHLHPEPDLPYAGTEGYSGSSASEERARDQVASGKAQDRQRAIMSLLVLAGQHGRTWNEISEILGAHHGQVTGSLSSMHKAGSISRLQERRGRSSVYVLPRYVYGRETAAQGRRARDLDRLLRDVLMERIVASSLERDGWCSDAEVDAEAYDLAAGDPWIEIRGNVDIHHLATEIIEILEETL